MVGGSVRAVLVAIGALALAPTPALAGRFIATGHDADLHCTSGSQCHYIKVAVSYVRAGAPKPSLPVLVIDRLNLDMQVALDKAFGAGAVTTKVVDPRAPGFATL